MRPGGFGLFGSRRPRDPERARKTAKILLIAGVVVALAWIVSIVVSRSGSPPQTHPCAVPKGATAGTETPPGNIPKLVEPLGTPDVSFTQQRNGQTAYVYCYNRVSEEQAQAALKYVAGLGYDPGNDGTAHQASFTSSTAIPYGISLFVTEGLDLAHAGTGSGGLAVTWVDEAPK